MKSKILIAILLFFIPIVGITQQIIDVDADFIGIDYPDKLFFYKKNSDNSFYRTEIDPIKINTYYLSELERHDTLINVRDLPKTNNKKFNKELNKILFFEHNNFKNTHNDREYLRILKKQPNLLFKIGTFQKNKNVDIPEWEIRNVHYFNYTLIRVNKKATVVMLISNQHNRMNGFIIPTATSYIASTIVYNRITGYDHHERKLQKGNYNTLDLLGFDQIGSFNKPGFGISFNINKKHQLTDRVSDDVLLNKDFDTLYFKNGYIIGQHKENSTIYNSNLENITPKNLRAIHFLDDGPRSFTFAQVLTGNEIKWLDHTGALIDDYNVNNCHKGGWSSSPNFIGIRSKNDTLYLDNKRISDEVNYEKAWFLNKEMFLSEKNLHNIYENFLIVRKENKSGLLKYSIDKNDKTLNTEIILPVEYDFIYPELFSNSDIQLIIENNKKYGLFSVRENNENTYSLNAKKLTLPIIYDDIRYMGRCQPFRLKKDKLYGFAGVQDNPKYTTLSLFNSHFARFTLSSGEQGWLDKEGNEYLDK